MSKQYSRSPSCKAIIVIALCLFTSSEVIGQWSKTASNLLGGISQNIGAMTFKNGIAWAASRQLFKSTDSGATWTKTGLTTNGSATSIDFIDDHNGLLVTHQGEVYLTRDGKTWSLILNLGDATSGIILDSLHMMVSPHETGGEQFSTDGGASWHFAPADAWDHDLFHGSAPGEASLLSGNWSTAVHLWKSTDYGQTWKNSGGKLDADCWSGVTDPCNSDIIYVPNEEYSKTLLSPDAECELFVSTNAGVTWNVPMQHTPKFWCGSVVVGSSAVFVPTVSEVNQGIFRSVDHGVTWQSIGGPSASGDTRLITAIDDNRVIATDINGSIWVTTNSGGSPVTFIPNASLFVKDTSHVTQANCHALDTSIELLVLGCSQSSATVLSTSLTGSSNFTLSDTRALPRSFSWLDSVKVRYYSNQNVTDTAYLSIRYDLGQGPRDTILTLVGRGFSKTPTLQMQSAIQRLTQGSCTPVDSIERLSVLWMCASPLIDSAWITGSSSFTLRNLGVLPRTLRTNDSVVIRYASQGNLLDSAVLHIRVDLGKGPHDTTIQLYGHAVSQPYLQLSGRETFIRQLNCVAVDTNILFSVQNRCAGAAVLDSFWLTGSSLFTLVNSPRVPKTILPNDFLRVRYAPIGPTSDTAALHLRYDIGNGVKDTVLLITGQAHSETPEVIFSTSQSFTQRYCTALDTSILLQLSSCRSDTIQLDSAWLTGSSAFRISPRPFPWSIFSYDVIPVSYTSSSSTNDTAVLHLQYLMSGRLIDTTIRLIAHAASPFLNGQTFQHLAVRSGAIGDLISLPMSVDMADSVALKNSWTMLKSVAFEIAYDRAQLALQSVTPAAGWTVASVNNAGSTMRIILNNNSGRYTRPFSLGSANFQIIGNTQGMTQITLQKLSLHIGQNDNEVCFSQSEDALWGIVIRPEEDVIQSGQATTLTVQPNPFDDHIAIRDEANDVSSVELVDILGHKIAAEISGEGTMKQIGTEMLPVGSYLLVCHTPNGIKTFHLNKLH